MGKQLQQSACLNDLGGGADNVQLLMEFMRQMLLGQYGGSRCDTRFLKM